MDSLGLLLTLILGGLGMFLVVLAVTFLAAKTITKQDFERFNDIEEFLVEPQELFEDAQNSKDIFVIDDAEHSNLLSDPSKSSMLPELKKEAKVKKYFDIASNITSSLIGNRMIKLST